MNDLPVTVTDLVILGVVFISGFLAYYRGAMRELLFLVTWGGAALATVYLYDHSLPVLASWIGNDPLIVAIANAAGLFVIALACLSFLSSLVIRRTRSSGLDMLDRSVGFVFGLVRGALVVCLVFLVYGLLAPAGERPGWIEEARLTPVIDRGSLLLIELAPEEWDLDSEDFLIRTRNAAAEEALRSYSDLIDPQAPASDADAEGEEGYNEEDRSALESIIAGDE